MSSDAPSFAPQPGLLKALAIPAILGLAGTVGGLIISPALTWSGLLIAAIYVLGLGLGAMLFITLHFITKAGWSTAFRRIPEAMTIALPLGTILMALILLFGLPSLYGWATPSAAKPIPSHLVRWLTPRFFSMRAVVYLAAWLLFASAIVRTSRRQDRDSRVSFTWRNLRLSAAFLVVFGITISLATFDWLMSLQPPWISTIYGVYNFAGIFLSGLAAITLLLITVCRYGPFRRTITDAHLADLGRYIFAFSIFWAYIWFSQYMLIWYANLGEEVPFYLLRHSGGWAIVSIVNLALNFGLPFLLLMTASAKRNPRTLQRACILILLGHWIDLYWLIAPASAGSTPIPVFWQVAPSFLALAVFGMVFIHFLARGPAIPVGDPTLQESLHRHA